MNIFNYIAIYLLISIIVLIIIDYTITNETIFKYITYGIIQTLLISIVVFIGTYKPQISYKGGSTVVALATLKARLLGKSPSEKIIIVDKELLTTEQRAREKLSEADNTQDRNKKLMLESAAHELTRKAVLIGSLLKELQQQHHNETKKRRSMHRDLLDNIRWKQDKSSDEKFGTFTDHSKPERYLPNGQLNPHWAEYQSELNEDW